MEGEDGMIHYCRREAFDEWSVGCRWRIQFFEPRLWQLGWPRWMRLVRSMPNAEVAILPAVKGCKPIELDCLIKDIPYGWVLTLPTLSIRVCRE